VEKSDNCSITTHVMRRTSTGELRAAYSEHRTIVNRKTWTIFNNSLDFYVTYTIIKKSRHHIHNYCE